MHCIRFFDKILKSYIFIIFVLLLCLYYSIDKWYLGYLIIGFGLFGICDVIALIEVFKVMFVEYEVTSK